MQFQIDYFRARGKWYTGGKFSVEGDAESPADRLSAYTRVGKALEGGADLSESLIHGACRNFYAVLTHIDPDIAPLMFPPTNRD